MKYSFLILASIFAFANAGTSKWLDFRVKFAPTGVGADVSAFWKVYKTLDEAFAYGWVQIVTDHDHDLTTVCKSAKDVRVCPLYDAKGFIAGMQLAVPPSDVEGQGIPYDFNNFPVYKKKLVNGVAFWTSVYYIVDPAKIAAGGRPSAATFGEGLWLKNGTSFTEIPTDEESIKTKTSYTWQNCIPSMGKHYYNNMTPDLKCEEFQPFFILAKDGDMIGMGWQFLGRTKYVDYNWYDDIDGRAVQATVPLGPKCLPERADQYGVISVHMFFIETPWNIKCNQTIDSVVPLPIP